MHSNTTPGPDYSDLELMENGLKLVSLTFGINLYTSESFYKTSHTVLECFSLFLTLCPSGRLNYYATETMKMHKPVTKRVLGMLDSWLKPQAPHKHYLALELKGSHAYQDAPELKFAIWSADASQQANIVSLAYPKAWVTERRDDLLAIVKRLADVFPLRVGLAGYSFECSRYDKRASEGHAWKFSMSHPGTDVVRIPFDAKAVGADGIKGVNWLTLLGTALVNDLGGVTMLRRRLSRDIELITCNNGVIVKAGPQPALGDVNRGDALPLYREVYRVIAPRIEIAAKRSMAFSLGSDSVPRTEAWFRRLGV